jgi:hypothetical protein
VCDDRTRSQVANGELKVCELVLRELDDVGRNLLHRVLVRLDLISHRAEQSIETFVDVPEVVLEQLVGCLVADEVDGLVESVECC